MSVLRAVVSDKDGIVHELVLRKRGLSAGYSWYYGDVPLVVTPARTPDEAVRILQQEIAPTPNDRFELISIVRPAEEHI